jgi:endonuclease/exonuclease/phosphatase family metal-dependent hydrolase
MAGKKNGRTGFFKILFIILNAGAALALGLSYLAPYVSPESNAWLPFFGLAYPILLMINIAFVLLWLFFSRKWMLLSLITILAGWNHLTSHLQFRSQHSFGSDEIPFRVISYNVRNFDIYNYDKNWKSNIEKRDKILQFLKNKNADIICFQEYVHDLSNVFRTTDTLVSLLQPIHVDTAYTVKSRGIVEFGLATFSRFPMVGHGVVKFDNSSTNFCIYTDLLINDDTVRVYNAHFESIHLSQKDYAYASEMKEVTDMDAHKSSGKRILSLLKAAFKDRASQARTVAEHISKCPHAAILCTDLNDTPVSYAYRQLHKGLSDAFIESGNGRGITYKGIFPSFRIDYIFHNDRLKAYNYEAYDVNYSDHYPLSCEMVAGTK